MVHWLEIGKFSDNEKKQWQSLNKYLTKYQESKATLFYKNNSFDGNIIKLECKQNYNNLDLECNSFFDGSIHHLERKPRNISLSRLQVDYFVNRYCKNYEMKGCNNGNY